MRPALLLYAAALVIGCFLVDDPLDLLIKGIGYFAWCVVQQLLLQNMIYRRVRAALGPAWGASLIAGVLFSVAHIPNPILIPATLVWGIAATRIFERYPSIVVLALAQTLLSSLLLFLTPIELNHQFRVGPGYWRWRPAKISGEQNYNGHKAYETCAVPGRVILPARAKPRLRLARCPARA